MTWRRIEVEIEAGTTVWLTKKSSSVTIYVETKQRGAMELAYLIASQLAARIDASQKFDGRLSRFAAPDVRATWKGSMITLECTATITEVELASIREAVHMVTGIKP